LPLSCYQVDLEKAGRFLGILEPGKDGDGAAEEVDGLGAGGSADFHLLFGFSQEPVNGAGTDIPEFISDHIGHGVYVSPPDEVKVQAEEGGEDFPQGQLKFFQSNSSVCATGVS
jgi:hypothetical protein